MARRVPPAFLRAVAGHRKLLEKTLIGGATAKMKKLYDEAEDTVLARIRRNMKMGKGDTFTVHQQRIVLTQLRQGQALATQRLAGDMQPLSKKAQEASLKGLAEDVSRLHKHFTGSEITLPVEEASVFAGVVNQRASAMMRMHEASMTNYGVNIVSKVEKKLALSLLQGDSPSDVYQDIANTIDGEWWQGERIVRTEMAYAFNATHADGIEESSAEIPELMQRWEEHCDDLGQPLDDRVATDSIAMHGQVTQAGGSFTMPSTAPFAGSSGKTTVQEGLVGLSWDFPPNRPNDRAVLSPWMRDWGVPGWEWRRGQRVWLVR